MEARAVGPWVGEQKPLGKTPRRGNPSPESTYLPTYLPLDKVAVYPISNRFGTQYFFSDLGSFRRSKNASVP